MKKERKTYRRYSDEELTSMRNIDMVDFLSSKKGYTFTKSGRYYICKEHDSLNVEEDKKTWHWNSQAVGGIGAIDWMVKIENYDFQEACRLLIGEKNFTASFTPSKQKTEDPPVIFTLPPKANKLYKETFMYLTQGRCISESIVKYCFDKKILYQTKEHNNAVFVGFDSFGSPKFAEVKGTNSNLSFRYNVSGSQKENSFKIPCDKSLSDADDSRVFVFEAPIDLLSHATLQQIKNKQMSLQGKCKYDDSCWLRYNRISLSGTSDLALQHFLNINSSVRQIDLCLDNDDAGNKLATKIYDKYTEKGYKVVIHHSRYGKDYNDWLCNVVSGKTIEQDNSDSLILSEGKGR